MTNRIVEPILAFAVLGLAACEVPNVGFAYTRSGGRGGTEAIAISGVPDDMEAVVSVAGSDPAPLPDDGIVELRPGLSGDVMISVTWQSGSIACWKGHSTRRVDLDAERAAASST